MAIAKPLLLLSSLQILLTLAFYQAVRYGMEIFYNIISIESIALFTLFSLATVFLSLILLTIIYKINKVRRNE